jgi:hypothetical protein
MITLWAIPFGPDELRDRRPVIRVGGEAVPAHFEVLETWAETGLPRWVRAWFELGVGPVQIDTVDAGEHVPMPPDTMIPQPPPIIIASSAIDLSPWSAVLEWETERATAYTTRMHGVSVNGNDVQADVWVDSRRGSTTIHGWLRLTWLRPCAVTDLSVTLPEGWCIESPDAPVDGKSWGPIDWQPATLDGQLDQGWLESIDSDARAAWAARECDPTGHGLTFEFWAAPESDGLKRNEDIPIDPDRLSRLRWMPQASGRVPEWLARFQADWMAEYLISSNHDQSRMDSHPLVRDHGPALNHFRADNGEIKRKWERFGVSPYGVGYWSILRHILTGCDLSRGYARQMVRQICDLAIPWEDRTYVWAGSMVGHPHSPDVWSSRGYSHTTASTDHSSPLHLWALLTDDPVAAHTLRLRGEYLAGLLADVEPDDAGSYVGVVRSICRGIGWRLILRELCIHYQATSDERFRDAAAVIVAAVCDSEEATGLNREYYDGLEGTLYKADWTMTSLFDAWDVFGFQGARDSAILLAAAVLDAEAPGVGIPGTGKGAVSYQSQRLWWLARWYRDTHDARAWREACRLWVDLYDLAQLWESVPDSRRGLWHFENGPDGWGRRYHLGERSLDIRNYAFCSALIAPLVGLI